MSHIHIGYWDDETPAVDVKRAQENYLREVFKHLPPEKDQHLLDVGAGTGAAAMTVSDRFGCKVTAVEIVEHHVEAMHRVVEARGLQESVTPVCADITELDYPEAGFDHIYTIECLHHIANRKAAFDRFGKWIKPGGRLVLAEHTLTARSTWLDGFAPRLLTGSEVMTSIEDYVQLITDAGFEIIHRREVIQNTVLKSKEWEKTDPDAQLRNYAKSVSGPWLSWLKPIVFWFAERAIRRGDWEIHFITALKK